MTTSEFINQVGPFYLATSGPLLLVHSQWRGSERKGEGEPTRVSFGDPPVGSP